PAEAPAAEHDRATVGQGDDLVQVGRSALLQAALEAFDAVDRDVLRQAAGQRLVDHRGATGWVEEEHARLFGAGRAGTQHADVAFDGGLQAGADGIRQGGEIRGFGDLRGGDVST